MMEHVSFKTTQNKNLAGVLHLPPNQSKVGVIFFHALLANKDLPWMKELSERISNEQNMAVLRFDFLGNGESDGTLQEHTYTQSLADAQAALQFMRLRGYSQLFLAGHSLGGAIALIAASKESAQGVIGIAPVSNPPFIAKRIVKREQNTIFVDIGGKPMGLPKPFVDSTQLFPTSSFVSSISCPVLLIHGAQDQVLFPKDSEMLLQALAEVKDKELHLIPAANHVFSGHWHEVFDLVLEWLKRHA